jgi:hypothetical protein
MASQSIEQFKKYLENQKDDFLQDGRRVEGIIRDIFPEEKSLIPLLTTAWKAGAVAELRQSTDIDVTIAQLGDRFCQEYGLRESSALTAVRVWAYALGVTEVVPNIIISSTSSFISQSSITSETKKCPFCSEEVKIDAQKCKHCHSDISDEVMVVMRHAEHEKQLRDARFIVKNNGTILDTKSGLMWAAKYTGADINWQDAKSYCKNYRVGRYTDWRMPTKDELVGLYAIGAHKDKIELTQRTWVWASETRGQEAACVYFSDGSWHWLQQNGDFERMVLPVRTGNISDETMVHGVQSNKLVPQAIKKKPPAVGTSHSVSTAKKTREDDSFIANDKGTVLDTRTNLMWAAKDNGSDISWVNAKSYCENYRGGGYTDWRMPTQDELAGLYDGSIKGHNRCNLTTLITLSAGCPWASETRGSEAASCDFKGGGRIWHDESYDITTRALPVRVGKIPDEAMSGLVHQQEAREREKQKLERERQKNVKMLSTESEMSKTNLKNKTEPHPPTEYLPPVEEISDIATKNRIRDQLDAWGNSSVLHPTDFGSRMKTERIVAGVALLCEVRVLTVKREAEDKVEPFSGNIPSPNRPKSLGKFLFFPPSDYETHEEDSFEIPDSSEKRKCRDCNGRGVLICGVCKGDQWVPCSICHGSGTVERWERYPVRKGGRMVRRPCELCGGKRVVPCSHCKGTGEVVCSRCKGHGTLRYFEIMRTEYMDKTNFELISHITDQPKAFVDSRGRGQVLWTGNLYDRMEKNNPSWRDAEERLGRYKPALEYLASKQPGVQDDKKLFRAWFRWDASFELFPYYRVDYSYDGRPFVVYLVGEDPHIHAEILPSVSGRILSSVFKTVRKVFLHNNAESGATALILSALYMAWANGQIQEQEKERLRDWIANSDLSQSTKDSLVKYLRVPLKKFKITKYVRQPEDAEKILQMAWQSAFTEKSMEDSKERAFLNMAKDLSLDDTKIAKMKELAKDETSRNINWDSLPHPKNTIKISTLIFITIFILFIIVVIPFIKFSQESTNVSSQTMKKVDGATQKTKIAKVDELTEIAKAENPVISSTTEAPARAPDKDSRFIIDHNNGNAVLDTRTNLMWAAKDNGSDINWVNAKSYCEHYRGGGYTDWRMPTQDELAGLYDAGKSQRNETAPSYPVHLTELIDLTSCCPWASETQGSDAATFDFIDGKRFWSPPNDVISRALPVRSGK